MKPTIAFLLLNYQAASDTVALIGQLRQQRNIHWQAVVVDNHSPDQSFSVLSAAYAGDPQVKVIQSGRNGGYAFGNNLGLAALKNEPFDYLAVLNNDISIDHPDVFSLLAGLYPHLPRAALIAPCMWVNGREDIKHEAWRLPKIYHEWFASLRSLYRLSEFFGLSNRYRFRREDQAPYPVDCLSGSFLFGEKTLWYQIGGFDEQTFLYGEETILGHKIKAMGRQNYLIRSLRYQHRQGSTTRRLVQAARLQRYWLESVSYYHRSYRKVSRAAIWVLHLLFYAWQVETALLQVFQRSETAKKKGD